MLQGFLFVLFYFIFCFFLFFFKRNSLFGWLVGCCFAHALYIPNGFRAVKTETTPECISRGIQSSWRPACACSVRSYMYAQRIGAVHTRGSYRVTVCGYEGLNTLRYKASGP